MGNLERLAISALSGEAASGSGRGPGEPQLLAIYQHGDSALVLFATRGRNGEAPALLSHLERSEPSGPSSGCGERPRVGSGA